MEINHYLQFHRIFLCINEMFCPLMVGVTSNATARFYGRVRAPLYLIYLSGYGLVYIKKEKSVKLPLLKM